MTHRTVFLVSAILVLAPRLCFAIDQINPDPVLQKEIALAATAKNDSEVSASTVLLRQSGGAHYEKLIPQLVYALMHPKNDRTAMAPSIIIKRLAISQPQVRAALKPYRTTNDERLRRQIDALAGEESAEETENPADAR